MGMGTTTDTACIHGRDPAPPGTIVPVDEIPEWLSCPICRGLLEDPVQLTACSHAFCHSCILQALERNRSCPLCRKTSEHESIEAQLISSIPVRHAVGEIKVRCRFGLMRGSDGLWVPAPHEGDGFCHAVVKMDDLHGHEASCPCAPITCPYPGCNEMLQRGQLEAHEAAAAPHHIAALRLCVEDLSRELAQERDARLALERAVQGLVPGGLAALRASADIPPFHASGMPKGSMAGAGAPEVPSLPSTSPPPAAAATGPRRFPRTASGWAIASLADAGGLPINTPRVVSASQGHALRVWSVEEGVRERLLEGHEHAVWCVASLPGGRAVSGSTDRTLRVWDLATGRCESVLVGHTDNVTSVASLGEGRVVSGSLDKTLRVWSAAGEEERVLLGHRGAVWSVDVAPDQGIIISGSADRTVRLWGGADGECQRVLEGHADTVSSVAYVGGGLVVSGSMDTTVRVWRLVDGGSEHVLEGHKRSVRAITHVGRGRFVSASSDHTLRVWDAGSGTCERVLEGHCDVVRSVALAGNGRVVSGDMAHKMRVWRLDDGVCERELDEHDAPILAVSSVEIAPM